MIVVFGKTVNEITNVIDLEQVWRFNVEENKIKFFKNDDTWIKINCRDMGTSQEVMRYITYNLANEWKLCLVTSETIKDFREKFSREREKEDLIRKEKELRKIMEQTKVALSKEEE